MGVKSNIEWTDSTWNCLRGCTPVSPGCKNCYASSVARRFSGPGLAYEGLVRINAKGEATDDWNGAIKFVEKHLTDPLRWKDPRRIFVNSMSDVFHESVTDEMRDKMFAVMALASRHTFQILTKRPDKMLEYISGDFIERIQELLCWESHGEWAQYMRKVAKWEPPEYDHTDGAHRVMNRGYWDWHVDAVLRHVMLGTSAENQQCYDERIEPLDNLHHLGWKTFLSLEPLLGPIEVEYPESIYPDGPPMCCNGQECGCRGLPMEPPAIFAADWVIVGAESGHGARPMDEDWVRSIRNSCLRWNIPFFYKQKLVKGKKVGTPELDGVKYAQFPEVGL